MSRSTDSAFLDGTLALLTSPYRRRVLSALSDRSPLTEREVMSALLAADELGDDPEVLRLKLVRSHLPKLAKHQYVEWDIDAEEVRRGPDFDEVAALLPAFASSGDESPDRR